MEMTELRRNLEIVFEKEEQDLDNGHHTYTVKDAKEEHQIHYPHADTLIQLYLAVRNNDRQRSFLSNAFKKGIVNSESYFHTAYKTYSGISCLCFYTLVKVGLVNEALDALRKRKNYCEGLFELILELLPLNCFNIVQLKKLSLKTRKEIERGSQWSSNINAHMLDSTIVNLRYDIFSGQISRINLEINEDKKTVSNKINYLGFNENYNELLTGIDEFLITDTEKIINSGMISNLRTFMADLLKDIAQKIADIKREAIPSNTRPSEMGNVRYYLKKSLELSDNDNKFIDSFIDILHAEGGHAFMSEKEYFRLARNIAIEIALFVLSKYEKKYL